MDYKDQKGAVMIEFAFLAPLLFLILFGIVEISLLFYNKAVITNASREGARAGIVFSETRLTDDEIEAVVKNYAEAHLITFDLAKPGPVLDPKPAWDDIDSNGDRDSGEPLTVTVKYDYTFLVFHGIIKLLGNDSWANSITLNAVTVMRYE